MIAISAKNLTRHFGQTIAVSEMSFEIPYGSIFGYLGANGAGKSTTIKMLCGILAPTFGSATIGPYDVNRDTEKIKEMIGYVSQRFSLYGDLTVTENLQFYGRIYGLDGERLDKRIQEVMELTGLKIYENQMAETLSGGWRQRLAIANAILHQPKIIFLDEPTAGIDPISRRSIWEILYRLAEDGAALFVTTHYMEEAERCNTIAFISQGQLLKLGTPAELRGQLRDNLLQVTCRPLMKASQVFSALAGVESITAYGTTLNLTVRDPQAIQGEIKKQCQAHGIVLEDIKPIEPTLEDVFALLHHRGSVS